MPPPTFSPQFSANPRHVAQLLMVAAWGFAALGLTALGVTGATLRADESARISPAQAPPALDASPASVLARILPAVQDPSATNLRIAQQAWQSTTTESGDILNRYALALAYLANNQHQPAFELIEEIPPEVRQAGPLRRARIWLTLKMKLDDRAREGIQGLIDDLKMRAAAPPTANDLEDLQFVTRLVTYLREIGERELPLHKTQADHWWKSLDGLPEPWHKEVLATQARVHAARAQLQLELEKGFGPWRERTERELDAAGKKIADITQAETDLKAEIDQARNELRNFEGQCLAQIQALQNQANQLLMQRNSLPRPFRPSEPRPPTGKSKDDARAVAAYERAIANYEVALVQFEINAAIYEESFKKLTKQMAALEQEAIGVQRLATKRQGEFRIKEGTLKKVQGPLQLAQKNEARLRQLLADRQSWDSPGSLATIRALDGYLNINPTFEIARIQKARGVR